jgi:hypothetical protein
MLGSRCKRVIVIPDRPRYPLYFFYRIHEQLKHPNFPHKICMRVPHDSQNKQELFPQRELNMFVLVMETVYREM